MASETFTATATTTIQICGPKMVAHGKSVADMLLIQLETNRNLFGIDCTTGQEYGYPKLRNDVLAVAAAFQNRGFGYGDVITIVDTGSYEGQTIMLAGLLIGATVTALDYSLKTGTLATLVDETKPDVIFCHTAAAAVALTAALATVGHRPTLKLSTAGREGYVAYATVAAEAAAGSFARPATRTHPNRSCAAIVYSSGTTGVPKGVRLSDDAVKSALISFACTMDGPVGDRFMTTSPIFWYTGVVLLMLAVHYGKPRLFFSAKPTAEQILASVQRFRPTFLMAGVAAVNDMAHRQTANGHTYDVGSLATVVVGGSPMRPELQKTIVRQLLRDRIPIKQAYGITEQGIIALWPAESGAGTVVDGCVGRPAAGIEIKIVGLATGQCVGPNTEGEIRVKSVSDMAGYVRDAKRTANAYDEDGWFRSGDVGYYTDDGRLYVVGRVKELMIYKGARIAPADVETVLLSHEAVLDAAVTSRQCAYDGDLLVGVVKTKPGVTVGADRLVAYVESNVKDHERLRGGVIFVDDVPRSPAGKLKRDELKRLLAANNACPRVEHGGSG